MFTYLLLFYRCFLFIKFTIANFPGTKKGLPFLNYLKTALM